MKELTLFILAPSRSLVAASGRRDTHFLAAARESSPGFVAVPAWLCAHHHPCISMHIMLLVAAASVASPVRLILDTDMGGGACRDVDDVVALCTLHALMDNGEVELLAVVQDTAPPPVAGVISVINHWYGRDDVPIGAYKGGGLTLAGEPPLTYVDALVRTFPSPIRNSTQVPDAVDVYRRVLAASPPRSVTIASVGLLTNLELLLRSGPDAHSPLSGFELVAEKVLLLAAMAGNYPRSGCDDPRRPPPGGCWPLAECNACGCFNGADPTSQATAAAASAYVAANVPPTVRVTYLGFRDGDAVRTGAVMESCAQASNPCRQALLDFRDRAGWGWGPGGRSSYDPLTTLLAVRGVSVQGMGFSECEDCDGVNYIEAASGANRWVAGPPSNQSYVVLRNQSTAQTAIDTLLCQGRRADRPSLPPPPPPQAPPPQANPCPPPSSSPSPPPIPPALSSQPPPPPGPHPPSPSPSPPPPPPLAQEEQSSPPHTSPEASDIPLTPPNTSDETSSSSSSSSSNDDLTDQANFDLAVRAVESLMLLILAGVLSMAICRPRRGQRTGGAGLHVADAQIAADSDMPTQDPTIAMVELNDAAKLARQEQLY